MSLLHLERVTRAVRLPDDTVLPILHDVSLTVNPGERVSIVGRSGSGKSTLLNILGLLDNPTTGILHFDGADVSRLSQRRRDRLRGNNVGFVFQQFNLLEGRTALENVLMPLMYSHGTEFWRRTRIASEMLERVGLGHRLASLPGSLSGGEQQRVAIARALVRRPRLILADEPTGALDLETGNSVMALMDEIVREDGASLVTITHDAAIAERSDRHFRLDYGILTPDQPVPAAASAAPATLAAPVIVATPEENA
ncbi:putative ABC transport system ATP-binding protein [Mycetocola sp. BIGb0189]|uniref:ABC transporter ATP-binding protein n=1 Tax=Mycetocola sp. BIGb0189 TaxID=2940604 RepID=UPI00216A58CE|nr:ABC transporter ATP-binding protein [Mycetocola sp. BIGb0189]MCS4275075.1 putative ABC transport system ATP-binding protein [Mycetocola sp. BIGb0189]